MQRRNWDLTLGAMLLLWMALLSGASAQVTGLAGWNIFLDPGHSQKENMGVYGYSEAERNLRVGLRLREMLLNETDIDTVYISRTNDQQQVSLTQRTDFANRVGAAWFHSIHSDAGDPSANSTLLLWGQYYNGQEKYPRGGKAMADIMVVLLTKGMRTTTRGSIGDCSFYTWSDFCRTSGGPYLHVNRETTMPSELSEAGFHTNPRQNQLFMNADWKRLEARTFFWSILRFHGLPRPAPGICTGIVYDAETGVPLNGARVTVGGTTYVTDTYESLFHLYSSDPNQLHNGFYYVEGLGTGSVELSVEADNYVPEHVQVVLSDTFFTFVDVGMYSTVPPVVKSTYPADGDTAFPAWADMVITFSRPMDRQTVESAFALQPRADVSFSWSSDGTRLTVRTDTLQFTTDYVLTIAGTARSIHGYFLDGNSDGVGGDDFVVRFRTSRADITPPKIVKMYPKQNATNVELHPIISAWYDEELDSTVDFGALYKVERWVDHTYVPGTIKHYVVNAQSILTFFPEAPLYPRETYVTRIFAGLRDYFGNVVLNTRSYSFVTTGTFLDFAGIDSFESGLGNWWAPQQSGSTTGVVTDATARLPEGEVVNLLTKSTTAMRVNYAWDTGASAWLIRVYLAGGAPKNVRFDSSYLLQAYVFGDASGTLFRFCVDDRVPDYQATNHEVSPWFVVDWAGWRLVSWDMSRDGTGTWLGDGNLDGTLGFDSIQLSYAPGAAVRGTLVIDDLRLARPTTVRVDDPSTPTPAKLRLCQAYPNPFNPTVTIRYEVPEGMPHVRLVVFDALGRRVKTLVDGVQPPGVYAVQWGGTDEHGHSVASGVYLCRLEAGDSAESMQLVLTR
ncbi:MAG: Ig-like domain-containing protein [candidate division KSB1 bacterium]|nr:Ig-like domain-containing protein [candidate division KSB1 bacterium]MDZ7412098.1 Ig-like domain-containing protein [candidate division KSB1 bacterium]